MNDQTHHTYHQIAADFAAATRDRGPILQDMAVFAAGLPAGSLVVDVGCGPGYDAAILREQYGLNAIGLDYSQAMLVTGREQYGITVPFVQASMGQMPFAPNSLDGIWACASLLHLPRADLPAVLNHFAQLLKPNGRFYLSVKQGDNEGYSQRAYGQNAPRYFTYWQPHTLDPLLTTAGFCPRTQKANLSPNGRWLVRVLQLC
jgi:ubiquinone/menaquinone biosynthesis C-methylase UbiE